MSKSNGTFRGIFTAIASPCDEKDVFLEDIFASNAADLFRQGVDGLYVCGGTGDGYNMRREERKRAVEIALAEARACGKAIIVQVGHDNTRSAVELAEHAASAGANAVSTSRPANVDHAQFGDYCAGIARASGLPLLIYHSTEFAGQISTADEMLRLLEIPGVIGLKNSDWDASFVMRILLARPGTVVFHGIDEFLYPGLIFGAAGGIGMWYNVCPRLFVSLFAAVRAGDHARAIRLQKLFTPFVMPALQFGLFSVFEAIVQDRGLAPYVFRRPRARLDPDVRQGVLATMRPRLDAIEQELAASP